ncbi:MAG: 4Fe-4S dicluster domain-containing protein [Deltaproteobacteria bacterium]|nr:MAG: 4Fe-4S dicluster domain-containing protein [Deltaproteobacteria bacterium]
MGSKQAVHVMKSIHLIKGYDLKIEGKPSADIVELPRPSSLAALPFRIRFVKPRLLVKAGDIVKIGTPIFEDKRHPEVKFLSPGGGQIKDINFGPRRVIEEIVIKLDADEQHESFDTIAEDDLPRFGRKQLIEMILHGGLWSLIRELPFRDFARPDTVPPAIVVNLDHLEPFQPQPDVYLNGKWQLFNYGLKVLQQLAKGNVIVSAGRDQINGSTRLNRLITHAYQGRYPAHDPGVLIYRIKKSAAENHCWYIAGQDVLLLAQLLKTGTYPTERTVVVAGPSATVRKHLHTRLGVPLQLIAEGRTDPGNNRFVVGGALTGYSGSKQGYLGLFETSVTVLPQGNEKGTLFDWAMPGFRKPSYTRGYLSYFNKGELKVDCNLHGGRRACIACNNCLEVCPVDIMPQLTYKTILAGEVEEFLAHGLLDCVECGLCSYVCPSKIELFQTLQKAKEDFCKELEQ